jgi:apolipoprotein N-acyltransferase
MAQAYLAFGQVPIPFRRDTGVQRRAGGCPVCHTSYGRLGEVICYDMDFVPYMRQAGLAQVGLVLAPPNDWLAIEDDHAHIAVYRAVENGFAMMRPSAKSISAGVDPLGRELVRGEYYATDRRRVRLAQHRGTRRARRARDRGTTQGGDYPWTEPVEAPLAVS